MQDHLGESLRQPGDAFERPEQLGVPVVIEHLPDARRVLRQEAIERPEKGLWVGFGQRAKDATQRSPRLPGGTQETHDEEVDKAPAGPSAKGVREVFTAQLKVQN